MNVRQFVAFIIVKVHGDDDSVEHADGRHRFLLRAIVAAIACLSFTT
jgi:hypothetical protein